MIVDLFAGPGGWSEGLRTLCPTLHATEIGIEWDGAACATRAAACHRTIRADIAAMPFEPFKDKVTGIIASPPCQDFSLAGKRAGIDGDKGQLIREVPRWVEVLMPEWFACEQVPPALPIWQEYAEHFRTLGYSVWAGILNAADYGVPQTRKRAFLIGSRVRHVGPPPPSHAKNPEPSLFGDSLLPWVTMAEALRWGDEPLTVNMRQVYKIAGDPDPALHFDAAIEPAKTLTGQLASQRVLNPGGTGGNRHRRPYILDEPAPTLAFGHGAANWAWQDGPHKTRITPQDALILQSFPANYPISGSKTKQFEQIGNAVCPRLAAHVLATVTGITL